MKDRILFIFDLSSKDHSGSVQVWQNGELIFDISGIVTLFLEEGLVYGIGNYTDHIAGGLVDGTASVYYDDVIESHKQISKYLDQ